jgi:transposase InsO family protein
MTVRTYLHSSRKRAETVALLDLGATENFMNLEYAKWLGLTIKQLPTLRPIFNVDGTPNWQGQLQFYTDLKVQTGRTHTRMRFFLTNLGEHKIILGYPWFVAKQPKIDWAKGWIDHSQLPIVLRSKDAEKARFLPHMQPKTHKQPDPVWIAWVEWTPHKHTTPPTVPIIPAAYWRHHKVFSEEASHQFPEPRIWDHAIELKPNAPSTLPSKIYPLTQLEQEELKKFVTEHLQKGYIWPSKSLYATPFFFIKKKDGKLQPVQDYWRINEWTIHNCYPLPLIPQLINKVWAQTLFTKFDVCWGYNNVRIKQGDEWKATFITNKGLFKPMVMFFGLTNSPATFQMMMDAIFAEELLLGWLVIYMDDILIATHDDPEFHAACVHRILDKLAAHDLYLKLEKCLFEQWHIEFLGVILQHSTIHMDPTKTQGVADWPQPANVTDVQAFLGFTGFYWYFIPNYSFIARPLLDLTKKTTPWTWGDDQKMAFELLKTLMCWKPVLAQPNYSKPFIVHMDTSAYGVGAILLQEGDTPPHNPHKNFLHPIAYYSASFIAAEQNYDIYEQELLAVVKAFKHWRSHLGWTKFLIMVVTDHANLAYWKEPKDLNCRTARWHALLQDYWFNVQITLGKSHVAADFLSRPLHAEQGKDDNKNIIIIPPKNFISTTYRVNNEQQGLPPQAEGWNLPWDKRDPPLHVCVFDIDSVYDLLEDAVQWAQKDHPVLLQEWTTTFGIERKEEAMCLPRWEKDGKLVVPPDIQLKCKLMTSIHDALTGGHPGRDKPIKQMKRWFWWPGMNEWVADYIKGCAACQQAKIFTYQRHVPTYRISTPDDAKPFQQIAMDLITGLPLNGPHDSILTIVDHGCSQAALFLPCASTITGPDIAQLYLDNIYQWFGLPIKMISDRDPCFTSHFGRALTAKLGVQQNLSTAFHPQTDGLAERTNQWIEQYLCLVMGLQPNDWSRWLTIATAVHNDRTNSTLNMSPNEALLG